MIFQFTFKKIISLLACISITISCLVIPASAVSPGTVIEGIGAVGTLWDISMAAYELWQEQNPDADPSEYPGFNPGGSFSGAGGSREDVIDTYEKYVEALETDLGTTTLLSDGGVRIYFNYPDDKVQTYGVDIVSFVGGTSPSGTFLATGYNYGAWIKIDSNRYGLVQISIPFAAQYKYGYNIVRNFDGDLSDLPDTDTLTGATKGKMVTGPAIKVDVPSTIPSGTVLNYAVTSWIDCYPIDSFTIDTGLNSRPSSIVGDYGIMGDDGTIVKVEGGSLVNESEKLVYSPTTAGEITYTDCVFDYADRSYTLTLEDGSTMKVVYGDENVTIHEGDTIYNVYYLSSDSGSGDGSGTGTGDGSVGDAVSGLLGGLGNILAGLIEGLLKMAAQAVEALGGLIDIFNGLVDMILGFFGGFTSFLGSMFPFLPEETFVILNFGLILLIAAAVIKKLFL